jgi:hypothetical protein
MPYHLFVDGLPFVGQVLSLVGVLIQQLLLGQQHCSPQLLPFVPLWAWFVELWEPV